LSKIYFITIGNSLKVKKNVNNWNILQVFKNFKNQNLNKCIIKEKNRSEHACLINHGYYKHKIIRLRTYLKQYIKPGNGLMNFAILYILNSYSVRKTNCVKCFLEFQEWNL